MDGIHSVLFDFDGLIANTEPLHFETFLQVLGENGIRLPPGTNQSHYIGIHDRGSFRKAFAEAGRELGPGMVEKLVERKSRLYLDGAGKIELFDGVRELLDSLPPSLPSTIASGGRRVDILAVVEGLFERINTRHMGQQAQLDLRIIGAQQRRARRRHEGAANAAAFFAANGNVLQVRIDR